MSYELGTILRARRAVSAAQRRESPVSWWFKRSLITAGALAIVAGSFVTSIVISGEPNADPARAAVLFLLGPVGVAIVLMGARLRPEANTHPLGEARWLLPLSRWRSALLAVGEELLSVETVFIVALGWAPWMGSLVAGESWLNAAGWASAFLAPAVAVSLRQLLLAVQSWATTAIDGAAAAAFRVGYVLLFVALPGILRALGRLLPVGDLDPFALPLLKWARAPLAPLAILAAAAALLALSAFIRSRRGPRWVGIVGRALKLPSLRGPGVSFGDARPVLIMFRMMAVQASRLPAYRQAAITLVLFSTLATVFPSGPFAAVVGATAFYAPIAGLYNLYGADSRNYVLWLASGRGLRDWTAARQLFFALYFGLFAAVALSVVAFSAQRPGLVAGLAPAAALALLASLIAGPTVSRFVITPHATEVGRRARSRQSGRSWLSTGCTVATGAGAGALAMPAAIFGFWWAPWTLTAVLAIVYFALRPGRAPWTWDLRDRMALAFRE